MLLTRRLGAAEKIRTFATKTDASVAKAVDYSKYKLRSREMCFGLNIVRKGDAGFVERFGKLHRSAKEGLNFTIPFVESIRRVTLREVSVPIDPQSSTTMDNVRADISGAVYFRVIDPQKACYDTYDLLMPIITHAQSAMRSAAGVQDLDSLNHKREAVNKAVLEKMQEAATGWGINILRYEITNVTPDHRVSEAMDAQSIAERKRRETELNANAQRYHDITVSEGMKQSVINNALAHQQQIVLEAEANKQRVILAAQAEKESTLLRAEAEAISIARIGAALRENPQTAQYLLAKDYMENVVKMLPKSTVFLTKDITDISKLVATATGISQSLSTSTPEK